MVKIGKYKLAEWVGEKELLLIRQKTLDFIKENKVFKGSQYLELLKNSIKKEYQESLLYLFLEQCILIKVKSAINIYDYEFRMDEGTFLDYVNKQIFAAEVISEVRLTKPSIKEEFDLLITYPNDLRIKKYKTYFLDLYPSLKRMINNAKFTIKIMNPFFDKFAANQFMKDIYYAAKSGVKIQIITREYFNGNIGIQESLHHLVSNMDGSVLNNIEIKDYYGFDNEKNKQIFSIHAKILIRDETEAYVGSANITTTSMNTNLELGLRISGSSVLNLVEIFNEIWEQSKIIELSEL